MHTPSPSPVSPEPESQRKRRRIAMACEECRQRKRKCDGIKPVCGSCSKKTSVLCTWNEDRTARGWSNSYVESLRLQIKEKEAKIQEFRASRDLATTVISDSDYQPLEGWDWTREKRNTNADCIGAARGEQIPFVNDTSYLRETSITLDSQTATNHAGPPASDISFEATHDDASTTGVDGMGVVGSVHGGETAYFGPSSTFSFLHRARGVMRGVALNKRALHDPPEHIISGSRTSLQSSYGSLRPITDASSNSTANNFELVLPLRNEADTLLSSYWIWFHSLYPLLHAPSFNERYLDLWGPSSIQRQCSSMDEHKKGNFYHEASDRLFHCLLNVVFAIGCHFSPTVEERDREQASLVFFDRAKRLMDFDMLAHGSLVLVQTLLIMVQYLQSTEMASSCWNMMGLAIRVAQGIGLHQDTEGCDQGCCSDRSDQCKTEMRRRAWTGCILLDRILSLIYGRPMMIYPAVTQNQLILPSAVDDEFLTRFPNPPGTQPENVISLVDCYVHSIKLQEIIGQVLTTLFYKSSDGTTRKSRRSDIDYNFQVVLDFDTALTAWHRNLPAHLRVHTYVNGKISDFEMEGKTFTFRRQATILRSRYLHTRMLVTLQPLLSSLYQSVHRSSTDLPDEESTESTMAEATHTKAANLCVLHAKELINLITDNFQNGMNVLPPAWYTIFYIHSCAIVILVGYLCLVDLDQSFDETSFNNSWDKCLIVLRGYENRSKSAARCYKMLELVRQESFNYQRSKKAMTRQHSDLEQRPLEDETTNKLDSAYNVFNFAECPNGSSSGHLTTDVHGFNQPELTSFGDLSDPTWLFPFLENFEQF